MFIDFHLDNIDKAAHWLLQQLGTRKVIALFAPMGAGKTTLTAALTQALGGEQHAASPTFSIINEYSIASTETMYHMDWYRLKGVDEAIEAGVEDALYSGHLCVVEWPEKAPELLPDDTLKVSIEILSPETRRLHLID